MSDPKVTIRTGGASSGTVEANFTIEDPGLIAARPAITAPAASFPAHSPGPWRVQPASDGFPYFEVLDALGGAVYRGPDEAVARLIAAAPELLDALRAFVQAEYWIDLTGPAAEALDKARALVASIEAGR